METEEIWKAIPGFEGYYEASTLGQIRGVDRTVTALNRWGSITERRLKGRVLLTYPHSAGGYRMSCLTKDGKHCMDTTHAYVAATFLGPRPEKHDVNHIDGNKANNRVDNLEYTTRKGNMGHAQDTGLWDNRGEKNGQAKATESQILAAHADMVAGATISKAAAANGLTVGQLTKVRSGKKWQHLNLAPITRDDRRKPVVAVSRSL